MEAEEYDRLFALEVDHWRFRAQRDTVRTALLAHLETGGSPALPQILEAGCGCGANAVELGSLGAVTAVDWHPDAVAYASRRGLPRLGQRGRIGQAGCSTVQDIPESASAGARSKQTGRLFARGQSVPICPGNEPLPMSQETRR